MAIENTDRFPRARHSIRLRTQLVVDIGAKTKEVVCAVRPGYVGPHLQGLAILQENNGAGYRRAIFTQDGTFNGSGEGLAARRSYGRLHLPCPRNLTRDND